MATEPLNPSMLIDAIVRQTTVLLAQLATASGTRASVANVANQVFLDLSNELRTQGVGTKVVADMFGMVLRSYHKKVKRLSESATDRGRSLWEAVYSYLHEQGTASQVEVMERFRFDDNETVRGVLRDLVESGLVFRKGRGLSAIYRFADPDDSEEQDDCDDALMNFVWVNIYQMGPITVADLADALRMDASTLQPALASLVADNRVSMSGSDTSATYLATDFIIPFEDSSGWEAAVFHHYQALVTTVTAKLQAGRNPATRSDDVGGSTYCYDLWAGHELEEEVLDHFRKVRDEASALRARVDAYNENNSTAGEEFRVTFYAGQNVLREDPTDD